jgi:hypothetical protein
MFTIAHRNPFQQDTYHWTASISEVIGTVWTLWVIYELMNRLLSPRQPIVRFVRILLQVVLGALVLLSVAGAGSLSDWSVHRITNISDRLSFSSNLILTGMFLVIVALQRSLHISWRNWITGVALGFGISASISLAAEAILGAYGKNLLMLTDIVSMAGFQACAIVWLIYLVLPERPSIPAAGGLQQQDLDRWSEEVERIVSK